MRNGRDNFVSKRYFPNDFEYARFFKVALLIRCVASVSAQEQGVFSRINSESTPGSLRYGYSQVATVAEGARLVLVAGQVGHVTDDADDFKSQVDRAFANLKASLEAGGATVQDAVHIS